MNDEFGTFDIAGYWDAALRQDADRMRAFFHRDAYVNWHNTNEHFTAEEFIRVNCAYPDAWDGEIERTETIGSLLITATHVFSADRHLSFHVTSFIAVKDGKISSVDEYWGDDGLAPEWRRDMDVGSPICSGMSANL